MAVKVDDATSTSKYEVFRGTSTATSVRLKTRKKKTKRKNRSQTQRQYHNLKKMVPSLAKKEADCNIRGEPQVVTKVRGLMC